MKKLLLSLLSAGILSLGATSAFAQTEPKAKKGRKKQPMMQGSEVTPKSVIHVVTVAFKSGTTPQQIQAVLDGVRAMPAKYPSMTRVWTKTLKIQNQRGAEIPVTHAFVMEFADEAAFKGYTGSDAQLEWYKIYEPVRERSTTHDITN
jgi:hypothetical protein